MVSNTIWQPYAGAAAAATTAVFAAAAVAEDSAAAVGLADIVRYVIPLISAPWHPRTWRVVFVGPVATCDRAWRILPATSANSFEPSCII